MHRRVVAAVLATTTAAGVAGVAAPSGATTGPLRYVALGDSYSAASGVQPPDPTAPPLAGTNPVIEHPNALGESKMAAQAIKVLGLS